MKELELVDVDEEGMDTAVVVVMRSSERRRLFEAVNLEAARGRDFLEAARARWTASPL